MAVVCRLRILLIYRYITSSIRDVHCIDNRITLAGIPVHGLLIYRTS